MTYHDAFGFGPLMARFSTSYEGVRGLLALHKGVPDKGYSIKVWCTVWPKKIQKKKVMQKDKRKLQ